MPNKPYDAERQKKYWQKYYEANKEDVKRRAAAHSKATRQKKRQAIIDAKSKPCMDCGVEYPYYKMQFDHVRGEKKFNIANAGHDSWGYVSWKDLLEEIAKCEVVCANCHCGRTWKRAQKALEQAPIA